MNHLTSIEPGARRRRALRWTIALGALVASLGTVFGVSNVGAAQVAGGANSATLSPHFVGAGAVYSMDATGITGAGNTGGPGSIEVDSWSWGASRNIGSQSSGSGAGKVQFHDISITRKIDASSPSLYQAFLSGKVISSVTLYVTPPAGSTGAPTGDSVRLNFTKIEFKAFGWSGSGSSGDRPSESITMSYQKVSITYIPQK